MTKKLKEKQMRSAETEGSILNEPHEVKVLHLRACADEDEKPAAEAVPSKIGNAPAKKADSSDEEFDESSDEDEVDVAPVVVSPLKSGMNGKRQAEEEVKAVTSKKQKVDEVAAKQKTIYVGNLSFKAKESDIINFFQDCGMVVDVCLGYDKRKKPLGYAHVEFETAEEAKRALDKNGEKLLDRDVRLQEARKWRPYPQGYPLFIDSNNSAESGGGGFVRGFGKSNGEDENPEAEAVSSKIGSAPEKKADIHFVSSSEESSDEDESGTEESPKIRYARNVSPDVVLRNATSDDIFKILVDYLLPDVDLESLENGKILQVIADDRLDAILGYVIFDVVEPKSNGCGHITSLFVNPIYRREGVASKLVESAEKDLRDKQGAAYVSVPVPKTNSDGLLFFEKMGYEKEAVKSNYIDGKDDANVIMTKKFEGKQMHYAETEGKRQAVEEVEEVSSKKQKVDEVAAKQKNPATKVVPSKNGSAPVKKDDLYYSSSEESSGESSDEDEKPAAEVVPSKIGSAPAKKADSSDQESDESSGEDEPNTPATQNVNSRVKTLYVGNLSFSVQKSDIEKFFQDCGKVIDVRLASHKDGKLKGFGHVEFATTEAAQYAFKMNGKELLQRAVRLDLARERGAYTPNNNRRTGFYKPGLYQGKKTTFADD